MKLLIWLCVTQAIWLKALGLYHTPSSVIFKPPTPVREDSYFGYSMAYDNTYHRLVISAPRENYIGVIYHCDIAKRNCTPKSIDINRTIPVNYTHDYWLGATVKAGPNFTVFCAPSYTYYYTKGYGTFGKCYKNFGPMEVIKYNERVKGTSDKFEDLMDTFGWSVDIASDQSIIVGGPGMFTGRAMVYQPQNEVPVSIRRTKETATYNFGYAVASGTFINGDLSYAVSSTYGKIGYGDVQFYFSNLTWHMSLSKEVDTDVVGSMFGAVLCAAKISGKRSDLLVGAPAYARGSAYNLGAVYIYVAIIQDKPPKYKRTIFGRSDGSYFGSAIINLGDIDGDKKDEVAIGAPFENNGRGAVYIYSGADLISERTERTLTYIQKIVSSLTDHVSFGMSLTTLPDYDNNGCNELAIGAPYSDAVELIRCMAAITVNTKATFPKLQNRTLTRRTEFKFQVCLYVEYPLKPANIIAKVRTTVEMSHSHARLIGVNDTGIFEYETLLQYEKQPDCKNVPFTVPLDGNYDMEIGYQISSTLMENPMNMSKFDERRVILSSRSVLMVRDAVWAAECSGNKECVPILKLDTNFSYRHNKPYTIGRSSAEYFDMTVFNSGEVAYDACVRVRIVGALVAETPSACAPDIATYADGYRLLCAHTKPLRTNDVWKTGPIVLDTKQLTNLDQKMTVEIRLFNRCKGVVTKKHTFVTPLRADPSAIIVKGATNVGDVVNMTKEEIFTDGKQIEHVYVISSRSLTNWVGLSGFVELQLKPYIKYNDIDTVYVATSDVYSECQLFSSDTERMRFFCKIDSLTVKVPTVKIVVPIFIVPGVLDNLENQIVKLNSSFTLLINDDDNIKQSISTTLRQNKGQVPLWVILVAGLVGFFILIIIAFILYECGFLRRKKREQLKSLRQSVRRQTIMRRSTASHASGDDRRKILGSTSEEQEATTSTTACPDQATAAE